VLAIFLSWRVLRANLRTRAIFNRADDELSAVKVDNLINFDTVKYFAKEKYEQERLSKVLKRWYKTLLDYFFTFRLFDVLINNLATVFVLVIGVVAWFDLQNGVINVGEFLFVLTFTMSILPQMTFAMNVVRHLARKSDDLERYLGVLDETVTVPDPKPEQAQEVKQVPGEIVFEEVSFSYQKQLPLLKDFNLRIEPGEAVALVGFSGAGKTTVAKLLMRMYDVNRGKITIDGVDIRQMNKDYLRSLVGIVPQEPLMFNNSVYYNITYARPESKRGEVLAAASAAQTEAFIENLSDGYQTVVGERGIKLSGGQRQRLAIARVMLQRAGIVIFDEATSSLDSEAEKAVQKAFWTMVKDAGRPVTSIIIAHRLSTIMRADRIVVMDEGRIVEVGKHETLVKKKKGIYARLWALQQDGFLGDGE
jgi:ATP-binding cassette subfamily B protein